MLSDNATWYGNAPAESGALDRLRNIAGISLPQNYLAFLAWSNGGEGPLGIEPGYIVIDSAEDAATQKEQKLFEEFFSGFFMFGGNGGGELLAFDLRADEPWPIVMIDMTNIDLKESVVRIADNFHDLLKHIGTE